jgi:hypothetical protein
MAKGKHATALFEVMSKTKLANGKSATTPSGGIPTPKWWFNSKNRTGVKVLPPEETLDVPEDEAPDPDLDTPSPRPSPVMAPQMISSIDVSEANSAAPAPRVQPVAVSVDPEHQQISLRLSYTSALIGGFGLFIALGLAVLIGKSLTRGPSPAIADVSTEILKRNPPTPGVMNVARRSDVGGTNDSVEGPRPTSPSTGTHPPHGTFVEPHPPATFVSEDAHRSNGLNYAIIQSYPDKETADKAADFLTKNGIGCTVEKKLPNWPLPWADGCVVVGIRGYAKVTNNPSLEAYKKSIMDVSAKFTTGRARFSGFSPSMYLWKKSN